MARIHQRVSRIPLDRHQDVERAIGAAARRTRTRDDVEAEWKDVIVPLEIDGAVHKVRIRAVDLGVAE